MFFFVAFFVAFIFTRFRYVFCWCARIRCCAFSPLFFFKNHVCVVPQVVGFCVSCFASRLYVSLCSVNSTSRRSYVRMPTARHPALLLFRQDRLGEEAARSISYLATGTEPKLKHIVETVSVCLLAGPPACLPVCHLLIRGAASSTD